MDIEYADVAKQTGKSISTIKKWRKKIENLSGYEFTKTKARVSRHSVQVFFDFSKDEVAKFIELSKEIDKTKDLDSSIKKVWGDLNTQQAQSLEEDLLELEFDFYNFKKEINKSKWATSMFVFSLNYLVIFFVMTVIVTVVQLI